MSENIKLTNVRIAFPNLFEPRNFRGEGEERYSATFIIVPGSQNAKDLDSAIKRVAEATWKKNASTMLAQIKQKDNCAYRESQRVSEKGEVLAGFEGMFTLGAASNKSKPPHIIDKDASPLTATSGKPYAGCYVDASVEIWAQKEYGQRINAKLRWVQFRNDGDSFGGGVPVSTDEFQPIENDLAAAFF